MHFIELRQALRRIRRQPAFAVGVVTVLALAIGANSAMFALVNAILLRPLPFADPDRLITFTIVRPGNDRQPLSLPDLNDFNESSRTLDGVASVFGWSANLTGRGDAERLTGMRVSGNYFELTGAQVEVGRPLQPPDEQRRVSAHQPWHVAAAFRRGGRCGRPADRPEWRSLHDRRRPAAGLRIPRPRRGNRGAVFSGNRRAARQSGAGIPAGGRSTEAWRDRCAGRQTIFPPLAGGCTISTPIRTGPTRRSESPPCTRSSPVSPGRCCGCSSAPSCSSFSWLVPTSPVSSSFAPRPTGRSSRSAPRLARPEAG